MLPATSEINCWPGWTARPGQRAGPRTGSRVPHALDRAVAQGLREARSGSSHQRPEHGVGPAGTHGRLPLEPRPGSLPGRRGHVLGRQRLAVPHLPRLGGRDVPRRGPARVMSTFRGDWHGGFDPREYRSASRPPHSPPSSCTRWAWHTRQAARRTPSPWRCAATAPPPRATSTEALNFAAVFNCPSCSWCRTTVMRSPCRCPPDPRPHARAQGGQRHSRRARGPGNDLAAALRAGPRRRPVPPGQGPAAGQAMTYHVQAHTNADDDTRYRERDEVSEWVAKDRSRACSAA